MNKLNIEENDFVLYSIKMNSMPKQHFYKTGNAYLVISKM